MFAYAERAGTARHVLGASKSRVVICVMRVCENVCCGTIRHCCAAERKASGGPVGPSGGHGSRGMQRLDGGNRRKREFGNLEAPKSQPSSCAWGVMRGQFAVHQRGMGPWGAAAGCRPVVQGLVQAEREFPVLLILPAEKKTAIFALAREKHTHKNKTKKR